MALFLTSALQNSWYNWHLTRAKCLGILPGSGTGMAMTVVDEVAQHIGRKISLGSLPGDSKFAEFIRLQTS